MAGFIINSVAQPHGAIQPQQIQGSAGQNMQVLVPMTMMNIQQQATIQQGQTITSPHHHRNGIPQVPVVHSLPPMQPARRGSGLECVPSVPSLPSPRPMSVNTVELKMVIRHLFMELSKGIPSNLSKYFSESAIITQPSLSRSSPVPYSGTYRGLSECIKYFSILHASFSPMTRLEVSDIAVADKGIVFFHLLVEGVTREAQNPYAGTDVVTATFNGNNKIATMSIRAPSPLLEEAFTLSMVIDDRDDNGSVCSAPPLLPEAEDAAARQGDFTQTGVTEADLRRFSGSTSDSRRGSEESTKQVIKQRRVTDVRPCDHNEWDNVRIKRGEIMLRCRTCQEQWRAPADTQRCQAFPQNQCTDSNCQHLHVHAHKQSLHDRVNQFGEAVLLHVPIRQRNLAPSLH